MASTCVAAPRESSTRARLASVRESPRSGPREWQAPDGGGTCRRLKASEAPGEPAEPTLCSSVPPAEPAEPGGRFRRNRPSAARFRPPSQQNRPSAGRFRRNRPSAARFRPPSQQNRAGSGGTDPLQLGSARRASRTDPRRAGSGRTDPLQLGSARRASRTDPLRAGSGRTDPLQLGSARRASRTGPLRAGSGRTDPLQLGSARQASRTGPVPAEPTLCSSVPPAKPAEPGRFRQNRPSAARFRPPSQQNRPSAGRFRRNRPSAARFRPPSQQNRAGSGRTDPLQLGSARRASRTDPRRAGSGGTDPLQLGSARRASRTDPREAVQPIVRTMALHVAQHEPQHTRQPLPVERAVPPRVERQRRQQYRNLYVPLKPLLNARAHRARAIACSHVLPRAMTPTSSPQCSSPFLRRALGGGEAPLCAQIGANPPTHPRQFHCRGTGGQLGAR